MGVCPLANLSIAFAVLVTSSEINLTQFGPAGGKSSFRKNRQKFRNFNLSIRHQCLAAFAYQSLMISFDICIDAFTAEL